MRLPDFILKPLSAIMLLAMPFLAGCDSGLVPPEDAGTGVIEGVITYVGEWPPEDELRDLRFIAMRFMPRDTTDFFRLNDMVIGDGLPRHVDEQTFRIENAPVGTYFYSGVAQKFGPDLLDWRPVGLVEANGGVFSVGRDQRVFVQITVDFAHPPPFPP